MPRSIPINRPIIGEEEVSAVIQVLRSGILTNPTPQGGEKVREFEKQLASYLGVKEVIAVNSGTSALLASYLTLNVKRSSEVLMPSLTFVATANAALLAGLRPVFVDVNLEDYTLDINDLEKKVTRNTVAIVPVHLYGFPADMDEVLKIAENNSLKVIEDAAQALGSSYRGFKVGTLGDVGCFSFYPGKIITTGEGGAIATNNLELAEQLKSVRTHGQVKGYDYERLGSNLRMPELEAAIGLVQLKKLNDFLSIRRRNAEYLLRRLEEEKLGDQLILPQLKPHKQPNWYLLTVRVEKGQTLRDKVVSYLNSRGIAATIYYPTPLHKTPLYAKLGYGELKLPKTEAVASTVFSLPTHPSLTLEDIEHIVSALKEAFKHFAN
ncbi:MAG: pyridoxal-5'-phosphate-dependent protein [Candidatus Methanomethylicota archaeon]|uniref:Pyridoxal-5'-phosphate-dependent protein n=1 Tax=Thermoproteota archaeon TaxID=2056631 RepID=A0A497EYA8_9CREN|nr:MAG: pyridoxal-5'-phosphate-dependent protein [Candidatus Verstraetearchaeota archaeon]RLE52177.1 MAG: pyridoxal-5'-phosphate-dependent protein [Candidatus Verstraetearchaeota archaeon]